MNLPKILFTLALFMTPMALGAADFPVEFIKVGSGVWIHRSYEIVGGYKTPSNGLIVEASRSVILIDTPWNMPQTREVLKFINEKIQKPLSGCFITHFHQDRSGGLSVIIQSRIPIYMTTLTKKLLEPIKLVTEYKAVVDGTYQIDNLFFDVQDFGGAHSPDNICVYIPSQDILFAGCLIKSADSVSIGNIADADLKNWPVVLKKLKAKFKNTKMVIPGHGEPGEVYLIDHTLELLTEVKK